LVIDESQAGGNGGLIRNDQAVDGMLLYPIEGLLAYLPGAQRSGQAGDRRQLDPLAGMN
jgi:hypothetical protein